MPTLLLSRGEVARLLSPAALLPALREATRAYSLARAIPARRVRTPLPGAEDASAMVLLPGLVPGVPAFTVKVHAKFPAGRPAIRGVLLLHDLATGEVLAAMDSTYLTAVRSGVAGALAADVLARPDASRAAIIGAGAQGEWQLRCLALVRRLSAVSVVDTTPGRAAAFAARMGAELGLAATPAATVSAAVADADIVVTATWARRPFLARAMLRPGTHITTLGPDEPGKCEVAADVLREATVVCDDRDLAVEMGAVGGAGLGAEAIHAELGEVLAGSRLGRRGEGELTVYGGVGLAFQDLVAAWQVYERAREVGAGRWLDFLAAGEP